MKKSKNLLLLLFVGICGLVAAGKVNAAQPTLSNVQIVCDPSTTEVGKTSTCYLIGALKTTDSNGFYALNNHIVLTDLSLVNATGANSNVGKEQTKGTSTAAGSGNDLQKLTTENYCKKVIGEEGEFCVLFYSNGSTNEYTEEKTETYTGNSNGYKVLGKFVVKLEDGSNGCGKICVNTLAYQSAEGTGTTVSTTGDSTKTKANCEEIHKVAGEEVVETGNTLSYTILIAGAFIAVCAVLVAKKNNKFYKV